MPRLILLVLLLSSLVLTPSLSLADDCYRLVHAIWKQKPKRILKALAKTPDVNCLPRKGYSKGPLHAAVFYADVETVSLLLRNGADPNMLSADGYPPIAFGNGTARFGRIFYGWGRPTEIWETKMKRVRDLLDEAGADFNVTWKGSDGKTRNALYYNSYFFMDPDYLREMVSLGRSFFMDPDYLREMVSRGMDPLWANEEGEVLSQIIRLWEKYNLDPDANPQVVRMLETVKALREEYVAQRKIREAALAIEEEAEAYRALDERVEVQYQKDLALPADLRRDKYLVSINRHLRLEDYLEAAFYYALMDRNGFEIASDALFFRGEAYARLGVPDRAIETFHAYAAQEGASGSYYVQALQESLRLTRTQHEESGGSDLGAFIAAGDRTLDDLIRADKYTVGLSAAIQSGSYRDAVMFLRLIEELGVVLDGSQQFYYAQSLLNLGERE